jgi:hypothetical protein
MHDLLSNSRPSFPLTKAAAETYVTYSYKYIGRTEMMFYVVADVPFAAGSD